MKKVFAFGLALAMTASLTACGGSSSTSSTPASSAAPSAGSQSSAAAPSAEKVSVRFGNTQSETDLQSQSLIAVSEKLAAATDGNFTAELFFSSSLGDTDDMIEQALQIGRASCRERV